MAKLGDSERARVIEKVAPDIVRGEDGYHVWWPSNKGALTACNLRAIADHLDGLNKPWHDEVMQVMAALQKGREGQQ